MSFSQEQLLYASGHLLDEFGAEIGMHRGPHEVDPAFRNRIYHAAFPVSSKTGASEAGRLAMSELTLRDYFAAKAMPLAWKAVEDGYFEPGEDSINTDVAACAYQMADAMLAARDVPATPSEPTGLLEAVKALIDAEGGISIVHQKSADAFERVRRIAERSK